MGGTAHEYAKTPPQTIKKLKYVSPGTKKQNWLGRPYYQCEEQTQGQI